MRPAKDTDFFVELPDVGVFRFGRRTFGDRIKIRAEYLKYVREYGEDDLDLTLNAAIVSSHRVLCVEAPAGWEDLEHIDITSTPDGEDKIYQLYSLLKAKEDSFRAQADEGSEGAGSGVI